MSAFSLTVFYGEYCKTLEYPSLGIYLSFEIDFWRSRPSRFSDILQSFINKNDRYKDLFDTQVLGERPYARLILSNRLDWDKTSIDQLLFDFLESVHEYTELYDGVYATRFHKESFQYTELDKLIEYLETRGYKPPPEQSLNNIENTTSSYNAHRLFKEQDGNDNNANNTSDASNINLSALGFGSIYKNTSMTKLSGPPSAESSWMPPYRPSDNILGPGGIIASARSNGVMGFGSIYKN